MVHVPFEKVLHSSGNGFLTSSEFRLYKEAPYGQNHCHCLGNNLPYQHRPETELHTWQHGA